MNVQLEVQEKTSPRLVPTKQRRAQNKIKQLSHSAVRVNDLEKTRHFYEDLLGLPMVSTLIADHDVVTQGPSNYIHCFFEMADGSAIAFFQFEEGYRGDPFPRTNDPYERHMALRAESEEAVLEIFERLKADGAECFTVDHDWCFSLYMTDPDGDRIEVTYHRPSAGEVLDQVDSHEQLRNWLAALPKHDRPAAEA